MTQQRAAAPSALDVTIRSLEPREVDTADRIMRLAFGTYLGVPDPLAVFGDKEFVRPRYAAEPGWAFAAELDGEVVGSNFAVRWGSFGIVGPLTIHPDLWDRGIATRLMEPIIGLFEQWELRQAALFTFPHSPKHIGLYQRFGFWPQYLTPLMGKPVTPASARDAESLSALPASEVDAVLGQCGQLTDAIFAGLDVTHEIRATANQRLGDTVLIRDGDGVSAFAVCHLGAGEAGSGTCFVKFGAVRPGANASERFVQLLSECEATAAGQGLENVVAGVNTARHDAYRTMLARGYRTWLEGVVMQRPNEPGHCRPDVYVIDDLR